MHRLGRLEDLRSRPRRGSAFCALVALAAGTALIVVSYITLPSATIRRSMLWGGGTLLFISVMGGLSVLWRHIVYRSREKQDGNSRRPVPLAVISDSRLYRHHRPNVPVNTNSTDHSSLGTGNQRFVGNSTAGLPGYAPPSHRNNDFNEQSLDDQTRVFLRGSEVDGNAVSPGLHDVDDLKASWGPPPAYSSFRGIPSRGHPFPEGNSSPLPHSNPSNVESIVGSRLDERTSPEGPPAVHSQAAASHSHSSTRSDDDDGAMAGVSDNGSYLQFERSSETSDGLPLRVTGESISSTSISSSVMSSSPIAGSAGKRRLGDETESSAGVDLSGGDVSGDRDSKDHSSTGDTTAPVAYVVPLSQS